MQKLALSAAALAMILGSATAALADRAPNPDERAAIDAALAAQGFSAWEEIEWDDGRWEVDNALGADGQRYDLELDDGLSIVEKERDD